MSCTTFYLHRIGSSDETRQAIHTFPLHQRRNAYEHLNWETPLVTIPTSFLAMVPQLPSPPKKPKLQLHLKFKRKLATCCLECIPELKVWIYRFYLVRSDSSSIVSSSPEDSLCGHRKTFTPTKCHQAILCHWSRLNCPSILCFHTLHTHHKGVPAGCSGIHQ